MIHLREFLKVETRELHARTERAFARFDLARGEAYGEFLLPLEAALAAARQAVDAAKRALGEGGPVWWNDGAPDYNRHLAKNTPYADWFAAQGGL
jgi:hypothetical protein